MPFVRRAAPPPPPPDVRGPAVFWFTGVCLVLLLVRLLLWRASARRAKHQALLEADRAAMATRSAARHRDDTGRSHDVGVRLEDCLKSWRDVRAALPGAAPMSDAAV